MSTIRKLALVVLAAAICAGLGLVYWNSQTETAYVARSALARYQQITADDLVAIAVPRQRAPEFRVIGDLSALVGAYAAADLVAGTLFTPGTVVAEPPVLRTFASGKELPAGLRGYPLTIATDLAPVLREDDLVDLVLISPGRGTATWLLSNVEPLYILASPAGATTTTSILALTPEQIASVEGAIADTQSGDAPGYAKLVLSQTKNPAITPGTEFEYRSAESGRSSGAGLALP